LFFKLEEEERKEIEIVKENERQKATDDIEKLKKLQKSQIMTPTIVVLRIIFLVNLKWSTVK
jgi:hypothetical protein